nr:hypothetical protein [Angustibacter aerolatus]
MPSVFHPDVTKVVAAAVQQAAERSGAARHPHARPDGIAPAEAGAALDAAPTEPAPAS